MTITPKRQFRTIYGALLWVLSIQYYIVQIITAQSWSNPAYSLSRNTISDLGNTSCGMYGSNFVCSPLHVLMNVSFVGLGITLFAGALLLKKQFRSYPRSAIGFYSIVASGAGTILVGLFPENTNTATHIIGAALPFVAGNIGLIVLGLTLKHLPNLLRWSALLLGVLAMAALPLFLIHAYFGIGIGYMERIIAYPLTIWIILFSTYLLLQGHHYSRKDNNIN